MYADDSILTRRMGKFITDFKAAFSERFEIEDIGPATWLLIGCRIEKNREKGILKFGQDQYVIEIVEEIGMASSTPLGIPMAAKAVCKP